MKENFAIKLRELRKASGMTQEQLAAEFGVSVQAVSKWETAASYPDIELMPRIADLFGVSLDELLRDVKNEKNIDAGEEIHTDAEQQCDAACSPESVEVEYEDENDYENAEDDEEDDDDENDDDDEDDDDDAYYSCDDDFDDDDFDDDDDETLYETVCPSCNNVIALSESILEKGEMPCPCCGEMLEFDYSDLDGDTFEVPIDAPTEDGSAE